ncbi:MAG: hypothetical protein WA101_02920 [Minisyncoccia bacterium]
MDISQSLNLNTAPQNPLFDPTYLNLEYLFNQILDFIKNLFGTGTGFGLGLGSFFAFLKLLLFILLILFIITIIYCVIRIFQIRKKEEEYLEHQIAEYARKHEEKEKKLQEGEMGQKNEKWSRVQNYINSTNTSDWKLAIIEADTMLEGLMNQLGFQGENLGEKLKSADPKKYPTLTSAWEPHMVRNRIAHEGSDFELPFHEAKRVISSYEQIFKEFNYI